MADIAIGPVRYGDLAEILENYTRFWGDQERLRPLHHPMFFIEFADMALVARDPSGQIVGYVVGFIAPPGNAYIHLVAVRDDARGKDIARKLYETFFDNARQRGATAVKAITNPENEASVAFHRRMGFTNVVRVEDYGGIGAPRMVMRRALDDGSL
jgi:ribosomal protein S18 acetylase RimI-like enzyme